MFTFLLPSIGFFLAYILTVWVYTSEVKKLSIKQPKSSPFYAEAMAELDEIDHQFGIENQSEPAKKTEVVAQHINRTWLYNDLKQPILVSNHGLSVQYLPPIHSVCHDCQGLGKQRLHKNRYGTESSGPR